MNLGSKLTVFQNNCETAGTKIYKKVRFFIEFLVNAREWYIVHKS